MCDSCRKHITKLCGALNRFSSPNNKLQLGISDYVHDYAEPSTVISTAKKTQL